MSGELNPYAEEKGLYHTDRLAEIRHGRHPNPVHLQLIVSDLCNHDCSFCAYRQSGYTSNQLFGEIKADGSYTHNPNRLIPTEKVLEILEDAAELGIKAIQFTGGGEPTVHREFPLFLRRAHELGLETALVTNGQNLNEETRRELLQSTWVRVSIDAGREETYREVRRVREGVFQRVQDNVRALVEARNAAGQDWPYIGAGFVVTRENWREILEGVDIAERMGVDNLRFAAVFTNQDEDYFAGFEKRAHELAAQAEARSRPGFKVTDNFRVRFADLKQRSPEYERCAYQRLTTYIGADQNLYRCCILAYNERGLLGSLKGRRLADFWPQLRPAFENFDARGCPRCQFNGRNRALNRTIDAMPAAHWNFI